METWKKIKGFDLYEVSSLGRVRGLSKWWVARGSGILKQMTNTYGYKKLSLYRDGKPYNRVVHRLVAEAFVENPFKKPQVNHRDGCKTNNISSNLEWCTPGENLLHSFKLGMSNQKGVKNGAHKLSLESVREIRERKSKGEKTTDLAREFGVHRCHINLIYRKGVWKDV